MKLVKSGFTLLELIITVSIMGILAAVVTPTYLENQAHAKMAVTQANMTSIRQAFVNYFYLEILAYRPPSFPPEPADNKLTTEWSNSTILANGLPVSKLFSEGVLPLTAYDRPFEYTLLEATANEDAGFRLEDPGSDLVIEFRP